MRKIVIICSILITTAIASQAQFFTEGEFGVRYYELKETNSGVLNNSNLTFRISPKVGYWFNDRIAVGLNVSYNPIISKRTIYMIDPDSEMKAKGRSHQLGFAVIGRYQVFQKEKFSILAECWIGTNRSRSEEKIGSTTKKDEISNTDYDIFVYPVLLYNLTDRLSILATCDFINLGYIYSIQKNNSTDSKFISKDFGFNAHSTIFSSLPGLRAGFSYKFK